MTTPYCTVEQVAEIAKMWTVNGEFTKNPVETTVESWIAQVSEQFNMTLIGFGFTTPVAVDTAVEVIGLYTASLVSDLVHSVNSSGRYSQKKIQTSNSVMLVVSDDIREWCEKNATALEIMGVPRRQTREGDVFFSMKPVRG